MLKSLIATFAFLGSAMIGLILGTAGSMAVWFVLHGDEQRTSGLAANAGGYGLYITALIALGCGLLEARIALKAWQRRNLQITS